MEYFELFERPTSEKEILGNKLRIEADQTNLLSLAETLDRTKEAIIIQFPIIEYGQQAYKDSQNFLKRGPEVNLQVPRSRSESIEQRLGPVRLRIDAVNRIESDKNYCGYVWTSQRSRVKKKVHLVDCIEGARLFNATESSEDHKIKLGKNIYRRGNSAKFVAEIPSRSRDRSYCITLRAIPMPGNLEQYSIWTDFNTDHGCEIKANESVCFRGVTEEDIFCPHEIAASLKVAQRCYRKYGSPIIMTPLAIPTPLTVNFYLNLRNNAMIEKSKSKRPLNRAELEALLWRFTTTKKDEKGRLHRPTWFTKTKFVNYNWS